MMKKRIVSLLLAAATTLALCTSALAYSEPAQFSDWLLSAAGSQEEAKEALAAFGVKLAYEARWEDTTGQQLEPVRLTGV